MPKLVKKPGSDYWYAWVTVDGRKRRVSTKAKNLRTAQTIAEGLERRAFTPDNPAKTETLEARVNAFLISIARAPAGTRHMYRVKTGQLLRVLKPQVPLASVGAREIDAYTTQRLSEGAADSTIYKELCALRGVLKLARRHGLYPYALDQVMPRWSGKSKPKQRWCTPEEAWALIRELPPQRGAVVAYHVAVGTNSGECFRAQPEDVSTSNGHPVVFVRGTKTETRARTAPVMPWGEPFLEYALAYGRHVKGRPMFEPWSNMRRDLHLVCEALKIPGVSSNDLRRTYSQWMRQAGIAPHLIAPAMGHADSRMVERVYGKLPTDKLISLLHPAQEKIGEKVQSDSGGDSLY